MLERTEMAVLAGLMLWLLVGIFKEDPLKGRMKSHVSMNEHEKRDGQDILRIRYGRDHILMAVAPQAAHKKHREIPIHFLWQNVVPNPTKRSEITLNRTNTAPVVRSFAQTRLLDRILCTRLCKVNKHDTTNNQPRN